MASWNGAELTLPAVRDLETGDPARTGYVEGEDLSP
jgi:hypothetical protein